MSNDITALALVAKIKKQTESFDTVVLQEGEAKALVEALEKAQQQIQAHERANVAQDDHINQQQDRIDTLEKRNAELGGQLSRYSVSPGQADQRTCESRAVRDALGFGKDADNVAPIDLRERIDGMRARIAELEAAEKRIAELESKLAKPVLLPKTNGYWNEQEKAYEEAITLAKRQVRLAGFSVEDM